MHEGELTLGHLKELVEEAESRDLPDETLVRYASQPAYPFQYSIGEQWFIVTAQEADPEDVTERHDEWVSHWPERMPVVIWFHEGRQTAYLNNHVKEDLLEW